MTDRPRHDRAGEPEQAAGRTSRCWREKSTATGSAQSAFDALTLEYNALRQELSDRLGNRQRTVTVLGASAALLAGLGGRENGTSPGLIIGITVTLVVVAIGAWVHNGRMIGLLSAREHSRHIIE